MEHDNKKILMWFLVILALLAIVAAISYAIYHYEKDKPSPSPSPNLSNTCATEFLTLPNTNIIGFGNSPTDISEDACQELCANQDCVAYNYITQAGGGSGCWIKQFNSDSDNILAFKNTDQTTNNCKPYIRFQGQSLMPPSSPNTNNQISSYSSYTEAQCQTACANDNTCAYYNYDTTGSNCYLYNIDSATGIDTGINISAADSA